MRRHFSGENKAKNSSVLTLCDVFCLLCDGRAERVHNAGGRGRQERREAKGKIVQEA